MKIGFGKTTVNAWLSLGPRFLPFADVGSEGLPLSRLLRLSLFQISVGMAIVLVVGTLNRVMIVELGMSATVVSLMVALPLLIAPLRVLIGHGSDTHVSAFGWRRVPYLWYGTFSQFAGFAIMPFALLVMTDAPNAPDWIGPSAAALAFFLVGLGLHTVQTAGLALAGDLAPADKRSRVVALLYVSLLVGMVGAALIFGFLLADFSAMRLIQVVQGAAALTMVMNLVALWKQEPRRTQAVPRARQPRRRFRDAWGAYSNDPRAKRLLWAVGLGVAGFSMQDVLIEPYGGEVLGLSVAETTKLTAMLAGGSLVGLVIAAMVQSRGGDPYRVAALGALVGVAGLSLVVFAAPFASPMMFRVGSTLIGVGGGLYSVGLLTAAMGLSDVTDNGIALGAWGAVQASAAGLGVAAGGMLRDVVAHLAEAGSLGQTLVSSATGYSVVFQIEVLLLFAALVAIGPLVRRSQLLAKPPQQFGLAEFPR